MNIYEQANILVDDDGTALLADFGLARITVDLDSIPLSATAVFSAGTVRWMSPELLFGKDCPPTQGSDRYALGMVIYEVSGCNYHAWFPFAYPIPGPDRSLPLPSPWPIRGGNRCTERGTSEKAASRAVSGFF